MVEAVYSCPKVTGASVPRDDFPAKSRDPILESGSEIISSADEVKPIKIGIAEKISNLNNMQPIDFCSTVS